MITASGDIMFILILILAVIGYLGYNSMLEQSVKPYGCGCGGFLTMIFAIVIILAIVFGFGGLFL